MAKSFWISLLLITALLFSRLIGINQSLWLDEAITAQAVTDNSLSDLLVKHMPGEFHPPLYYILIWLWVKLFGNSEISLRSPSVIFGAVLTMLLYKYISNQLRGKTERVLSLIVLASSPLLFYYSQEARMYMLAALLGSCSMVCFWTWMQGESWAKKWYVLSTYLMFLTHYTVWFLWIVQVAWFVIYKKGELKRYGSGLLIPLTGVLIDLPLLFSQIRTGINVADSLPVWQSISEVSIKNILLIPIKAISGHIPVDSLTVWPLVLITMVIWLLVVFLPIIARGVRSLTPHQTFLWLWLVLPVFIGTVISFVFPMLSYFRFLYIIPAFYVLFFENAALRAKKFFKPMLIFIICTNIYFVASYLFNTSNQREDWRKAVSYIKERDSQASVVLVRSVSAPFDYYNQKSIPTLKSVDYSEIDNIRHRTNVWLVGYAQPIFDPDNIIEQTMLDKYGFQVVDQTYFTGDIRVKYLYNPNGELAYDHRY